ncbi:MAG: EAL domain-containing protein [Sulfurovaceae bacterium]|nr:EAL domain-containing protein [Sulfurovaceae bacterium]MDD5548243.1 EAL domain-containing protein [Sulfurovaceae bacterium]
MLVSQKIERERKFKLALRAGLPILALIGLIVYSVFQEENIILNTLVIVLFIAMCFITVYFIFFIIELSASEKMIDDVTNIFKEQSFIKVAKKYKIDVIALIEIGNFDTIEEFYNTFEIENMLKIFVNKLNMSLKQNDFNFTIMGRRNHNGFLIATKDDDKEKLLDTIKVFTDKNNKINTIDIEYNFAITDSTKLYDKTILYLKDLIKIQKNTSKTESLENNIKIEDIEKLTLQALEHKNLIFTYKPLMSLKDNNINIYEVFVKLKANNSEDLLPRFYLPILNSLGLSREYDLTIAKHIVRMLEKIDKNVSIAFNLSPFSLRDVGFQKKLLKIIKSSDINPSRIIIQLYEKKTHHDLSGYLKILESLRDEGVRICIDNFGSSNSSMDYLRHFNFDMIQFDRDYTQNIYDDKTSSILSSMVEMSKKNSIITIAKWVDKKEQKELLEAFDIDYIQGFEVHKPLYEDEFLNKLQKENS